jgi:hypothetical protein
MRGIKPKSSHAQVAGRLKWGGADPRWMVSKQFAIFILLLIGISRPKPLAESA